LPRRQTQITLEGSAHALGIGKTRIRSNGADGSIGFGQAALGAFDGPKKPVPKKTTTKPG